MKNLNTNQWFVLMTIFAFLAFIAFFNVVSAFADEKNLNTEFTVGGIVSLVIAAICLVKAKKVSN